MFQQGRTKTGGRKKGTANKTSVPTRTKLANFVNREVDNLPTLILELTPKERADLLAKLIPYVYPKKQEIDVKAEIETLLANIENLSVEQLERLKEIIADVTS